MIRAPWSPSLGPLVFLIAGCATEPREPLLEGAWGGEGIGLVASSKRVQINLPCSVSGVTRGPVLVDSEGHFDFPVAFRGFYADYYADVTGTVTGLRMDLVLTIPQPEPPDYSQRLELTRGRAPELEDYVCLGQQ